MAQNRVDPFESARPETGAALRLVRLERHYACRACGGERRSWARMSACPDCGEAFAAAVIRRAALTM